MVGGRYAESWRGAMQEEWKLKERVGKRWQKGVVCVSLGMAKRPGLEGKEAAG